METIRARVIHEDELYFIDIEVGNDPARIPISEDKPNEVKSAFNKLIKRLKRGEFQIELEKVEDNLFSQIAKEYIGQLNREMHEVHGEMENYGLVES